MLTFADDFLWKVYICFLRQKNETFSMFKKFKALVRNQTGRKIKKLGRRHWFLNFMRRSLMISAQSMAQLGTRHWLVSLNKMKFQNASIRFFQRKLTVCFLMEGFSITKLFWIEAISTSCYLVNRSPHTTSDFQILAEVC